MEKNIMEEQGHVIYRVNLLKQFCDKNSEEIG